MTCRLAYVIVHWGDNGYIRSVVVAFSSMELAKTWINDNHPEEKNAYSIIPVNMGMPDGDRCDGNQEHRDSRARESIKGAGMTRKLAFVIAQWGDNGYLRSVDVAFSSMELAKTWINDNHPEEKKMYSIIPVNMYMPDE